MERGKKNTRLMLLYIKKQKNEKINIFFSYQKRWLTTEEFRPGLGVRGPAEGTYP